mgnify:CR=1 FL=1
MTSSKDALAGREPREQTGVNLRKNKLHPKRFRFGQHSPIPLLEHLADLQRELERGKSNNQNRVLEGSLH